MPRCWKSHVAGHIFSKEWDYLSDWEWRECVGLSQDHHRASQTVQAPNEWWGMNVVYHTPTLTPHPLHKQYRPQMNDEVWTLFIPAHRTGISEILPWDRRSYLTYVILPTLSHEAVHWLYRNSRAWSSSDAIVMLKWHHHIMSHLSIFSLFRNFWEHFC